MEGFELHEATPADAPALARLIYNGWADDTFWLEVISEGTVDQVLTWLQDFLTSRFSQPHNKTFKIAEASSGKVVAYTNLLWPAPKPNAGAYERQLGMEQSGHTDMPKPAPPPAFITKLDIWSAFQATLSATSRFGYDSTQHFHRRGTFVHVDYQRRGLGKWLTRHCNAVADEHGAATFVGAKRKSRGMFLAMGFQAVGVLQVQVDAGNRSAPVEERFNCLRRLVGQQGEIEGVKVVIESEKYSLQSA